MKLETGQAVRVYTTTPMLTKPVGGESMATSLLTISEGMAELNAKTSRCHVLLKASSTSTDAITLGTGWIVAAGEQRKHYVNCCRRLANWSQCTSHHDNRRTWRATWWHDSGHCHDFYRPVLHSLQKKVRGLARESC
ncbi:hypothetical protein PTW35_08970 [Photobacterium sp. DA100]|uniref:hypothetical protein n=1 Tax=Photobacterium sp. DA100 TaxID=3027472 RepID=UPI002478434E|nr:hypothetical protein [Photobacterium sp. DA100]WEM43888.1 hypothetical protein PTW35_08970 [Photobacterium sp. DA100]